MPQVNARRRIQEAFLPIGSGCHVDLPHDGTEAHVRRLIHNVRIAQRREPELQPWLLHMVVRADVVCVNLSERMDNGRSSNSRVEWDVPVFNLRAHPNINDVSEPERPDRPARNAVTFGVEIEVVGLDPYEASDVLQRAGIQASAEGYNHRTRRSWKVVPDGSLSSRHGGSAEVVSPPLDGSNGNAAMEQVRQVCDALRSAGATVDRSCGLHVHVLADDLDRQALADWLRLYVDRQDSFDQLVSASRRNGQWCGYWDRTALDECVNSILRAGEPRATQGRYTTVNVDPYPRQGTIEFRQHQGTVDGDKVVRWVELLLATRAAAVAGQEVRADLDGMLDDLELRSSTRHWHRYRASVLAEG